MGNRMIGVRLNPRQLKMLDAVMRSMSRDFPVSVEVTYSVVFRELLEKAFWSLPESDRDAV